MKVKTKPNQSTLSKMPLPSNKWQDKRKQPQPAAKEIQVGNWEEFLH